jgi:Mce-associated membrane protein
MADDAADPTPGVTGSASHVRIALAVGLVLILVLGGLTGWLGLRAYQSHQADERRQTYLRVAAQGAINLMTIDYTRVDQDVARILALATGKFHDDFQKRAGPLAEAVERVKSKSVGHIAEIGIQEATPDGAQILVAVRVDTVIVGQPAQAPQAWRMRISVARADDDAKVSDVEFVR